MISKQGLEVFAVMLTDPDAGWHGLGLIGRTGLKSGTMYPLLARFEAQGWLVSGWEDVDPHDAGRPRRRFYRFTVEGVRVARAELATHLERLSPR